MIFEGASLNALQKASHFMLIKADVFDRIPFFFF